MSQAAAAARWVVVLFFVGCASIRDRPAASRDLNFERDRTGGTLARVLDLARAGKTSRELHRRYYVSYAVVLENGLLKVTVWAQPTADASPSEVAASIERAGGEVLQGAGGQVRARLTLDQVGVLSHEAKVRTLRLARHHEPIP